MHVQVEVDREQWIGEEEEREFKKLKDKGVIILTYATCDQEVSKRVRHQVRSSQGPSSAILGTARGERRTAVRLSMR